MCTSGTGPVAAGALSGWFRDFGLLASSIYPRVYPYWGPKAK